MNKEILANKEEVKRAILLLNSFQRDTINYYHSRRIQEIIFELRGMIDCNNCEDEKYHKFQNL